ncbi:tRNA (adenosine(37)-N6)-threonylcarbamoyltransferase complex dimerization subunit type 1 TsaB [Desulfopila sp. IMCC35008]|uniref:tRNA (adenosine(37)-N6)-threonylcarbamoyltransferase complex dimerization subunit type 1 TsaB n=1 Tax=Desulfopila sp. IMCC35008 TaxID=2653858 RepID=UPI0013D343FF|nr:tRNA (adenosine(37)-N6)-threonylcarbamoyltransferase complex dimerization subunit type 1 TsaB [Desulfopila sp. IMCC35008]
MNEQPRYILAIDTATPCSTVAITRGGIGDGEVTGTVSLSSSVTHSRRLLSAIDWLLTEAGVEKNQVTGYATGLGPGSFTGLRIGMATAKGLAGASDAPLYGVSTLDMLASCCTNSNRLICSVLDARKKELYAAFYRMDVATGYPRRISNIEALPPESLVARITEPVLMIGDGLKAYGEILKEQIGEKMSVAPAHLWSPSAATLGLLAGDLARRNETLDISAATPFYVRASDAELNLKKKS